MLFEKSCIGETELGSSNQEVAPSTGKNNKVALEPSQVCVSLQLFQVMKIFLRFLEITYYSRCIVDTLFPLFSKGRGAWNFVIDSRKVQIILKKMKGVWTKHRGGVSTVQHITKISSCITKLSLKYQAHYFLCMYFISFFIIQLTKTCSKLATKNTTEKC